MSENLKSIFWSRVSAALLGIVAIGGAISYAVPNEVEVEVPINVSVPGEVIEREVQVDNGNLELVLDHIYDNDGDINYILEDLDDNEVEKVVGRIVFVNEAKSLAASYVELNMADELDKEVVSEISLDEDDIERIKVESDSDEISIDDIDFDDSDANLLVNATFEQDDVDYKAVFDVKIKDGLVDDMELVSVNLD